jgi:molecular chaperone GrpE
MSDDAEANVESAPNEDAAAAVDGDLGEREETDADRTATDLAARVATVDEDLAAEVAELATRTEELESEVDELESEVDELRSKLKRKQADFQNYKKRTKRKQEQLAERATADLVERLVPVRDNLLRALDQEEGADLRPGVESTLAELDRVLEAENVTPIEPEPGSAVDPHRHEVMLRVDADQPEGTVVDLYQPGYEMADKVLRPAQVTVSADDAEE